MKRCLCILSSLDAGGAETFLMKLYRVLPSDRYQFDFVVSKENGCYTREVVERGGKIYFIPTRTKHPIRAFCGIRSAVKDNQYDYVLKLGENSLAVVDLIAARWGDARVVALRACNAPTGLGLLSRTIHAMLRPILNGVATVRIAPSQLAADFMFGKRADVHLLHNGVDLDKFRYDPQGRDAIREEFDLKDKLVIGHVGRFHKQKNHLYLLEVFREISIRREDAMLLLVGTGEDQDLICSRIQALGLENKVILAGQRFDIPGLLSAMDVFVFPSLHEGMPNTVIEAQATGLPCVIADTITREANLTGLVQYLPLSETVSPWAEAALAAAALPRRDTAEEFRAQGYDIQSVAKEFVTLLGMADDTAES